MFGRPKNNSDDEDLVDFQDNAKEDFGGEPQRGANAGAGAGFLLDRSKPSVISEGFSLMGDISSEGVLHVEGFIKGTIKTDAVNIGQRGSVEGQVTSKSLHVKGAFVGTAVCDELVIASKARVVGRITYRSLAIQRGAQIEGDLIHVA